MKAKNNSKPDNPSDISQTSHVLFGSMMKESLIPVNLEVESNYEVGKAPPKLDVLIIRRTGPRWSNAQLEFLPDGIRQTPCKHVILELKYTESVNQVAVFQTMGYLGSYVQLKSLKVENVCAFLICSKKPQKSVLEQIGFVATEIEGVYQPRDNRLMPIQLISLNELSNAPYNLWIKLFSSKITQRFDVLNHIMTLDFNQFSRGLIIVFIKIIKFWKIIGETTMKRIHKKIVYDTDYLTDEDIAIFFALFKIKPEMAIRQFKPEEIVALFKPEDVVSQLKPEDRLRGLKPEDVVSQLKPEDRLRGLKPEDVVTQLKPEDRLKGLDPEIIEAYLKKIREQ